MDATVCRKTDIRVRSFQSHCGTWVLGSAAEWLRYMYYWTLECLLVCQRFRSVAKAM